MGSQLPRALLIGLLSAGISFTGSAQSPRSGPAAEGDLLKIAENAYARVVSPDGNAVSNAGVVILERSVVVFDTHFTPEGGQALLAKIRAVTPKPVRFIVNSHFHADHTHGNQAFAGDAQIIGSTNARRDVLQKDLPALNRTLAIARSQIEKMRKDISSPETDAALREQLRSQINGRQELLDRMSKLKILPPLVTLDDRLSIVEGKRVAELRYIGAGHTDGDVILYLPSEKVVYLGDLFFNGALPNTQDGNILEWMKSLEEVLKIDADKYVPGHGPVGTRKDVKEFLGYFEELKALVEPAIERGDSVEQVLRDVQIPAKYASYKFANFFPANVQKMYAELRALQLAAPAEKSPEGAKKKEPDKPEP